MLPMNNKKQLCECNILYIAEVGSELFVAYLCRSGTDGAIVGVQVHFSWMNGYECWICAQVRFIKVRVQPIVQPISHIQLVCSMKQQLLEPPSPQKECQDLRQICQAKLSKDFTPTLNSRRLNWKLASWLQLTSLDYTISWQNLLYAFSG